MLKRIISFLASAVILCGFTGCSLVERDIIETTINTEVPQHMIFLGDSIAAGFGLEGYTPTDNYNCPDSYANILKEKYTAELSDICTHEMQNFAVSGADSADLLELINSGKLDPALEKTDAVVISIGGNDLLHIIFGLFSSMKTTADDDAEFNIFSAAAALLTVSADIDKALTEFEANLREISASLNEKTEGTVYIQTLYDPLEVFSDMPMITEFSAEKLAKFNDIIKNDSAELNYRVIDAAADFEGKCDKLTRIADIDIHPNEEGHRVIADAVDRAFRADGFTVTVQEYGEPHLTLSAIFLILGGLCATFLVVVIIIPKLFKKYEE